MAGDYSRRTFNPSRDYAGVLMQQGRVTLDSDFNELVEVLDRRLRAEVLDMFGRCVVSSQTPDAFLIALSGGDLTISPGRAYVDGLLAENHGLAPLAYDPVLGEQRGTGTVGYDQQPYFPNAAAVAPLPTSGTYVVYLDVWERDVTYLEDPNLVEKAIGVDTAARRQTVWQVRLLEAPDGTTCEGRVPGWDDLTAPSAGRLTTAAVGVPASTDPCTIPPAGGYRGTENRFYRVEIHDPGPLGTATFKWSRDDASIAARVDTIDPAGTELVVGRVGRDGVQRIAIDDWVEVNDDWLELGGLPGELRKVVAIDEVRDAITLSAPLTPGKFDATDAGRHTSVTRWDQSGAAVDAAGGVVAVPTAAGTPLVLEDGVQISFSDDPAGGELRTGDFWVFAARTVDASVEQLVDAPPAGIQHHVCRLAVVTFPDSVTDCRQPPDGGDGHDCACDVCVTPESHATGALTIQHAVDMVRATGGKVCLQIGLYKLDAPVQIGQASSIELQGKGWQTILITNGAAPAMIVERSLGVTIDRLSIVTSTPAKQQQGPSGIAIVLHNTIGTIIERCALLQLGMLQTQPPGGGGGEEPPGGGDQCPPEQLQGALGEGEIRDFAAVFGPKGVGAPLIVLDGLVLETVIQDNLLVGTSGVGQLIAGLFRPLVVALATSAAELGRLITYDLRIERNVFLCWLTGVSLEGFSTQLGDTRIGQNSFLACLRAGVALTGMTGPGGRVDVIGNILRVIGYGIAASTSDTRINDNDVSRLQGLGSSAREGSLVSISTAFTPGSVGSVAQRVVVLFGGAAIVLVPGARYATVERCQIVGNRVTDVAGDAISIQAMVDSALIADNQVAEVGGAGIAMSEAGAARELRVERNDVLDAGLLRDGAGQVAAAVQLSNVSDVSVVGNAVAAIGVGAVSASLRWGIAVDSCQSIRIADNTVASVGPPAEFTGISAGIVVLDAFRRADVLDNSVRRVDDGGKEQPLSRWFGILIAAAGAGTKTATGSFTVQAGDEALLFNPARGEVARFLTTNTSLAVRGNVVETYGEVPAVLLETAAACLFNDNRCSLIGPKGVPTARVAAGAAIAASNYLQGTGAVGLELLVASGNPFTVLGNLSAEGISVNGTPLAAPWAQLNMS
jgi:Family of unknown function (DUF6519)/Right handed beta helix region